MQLLLIVHPRFISQRKVVQDIPKYSKYKDLYVYARAIQEYQKLKLINNRTHTDIEMSTMYLEQINTDRY